MAGREAEGLKLSPQTASPLLKAESPGVGGMQPRIPAEGGRKGVEGGVVVRKVMLESVTRQRADVSHLRSRV